jgi:hypothetical protein
VGSKLNAYYVYICKCIRVEKNIEAEDKTEISVFQINYLYFN